MASAERFTAFSNPVISAHALSRLASIVCPDDRNAASGLFAKVFSRIDDIKDSVFRDPAIPRLPVNSFSALLNSMSAAATKCDPGLARLAAKPTYEERRTRERSAADTSVLNAAMGRVRADPDRAAQLIEFVMETADPAKIDYEALSLSFTRLRGQAPDLSDELFERALKTAVAESDTARFSILGKYLFANRRPPGVSPSQKVPDSYQGTKSLLYDFSRVGGNFELVVLYIRGLMEMVSNKHDSLGDLVANPHLDLEAARTLAEFMAKHAEALEIPEADALKPIIAKLEALPGGKSALPLPLIASLANPYPKNVSHIASRRVLDLIRSKDFEGARSAISEMDDKDLKPTLSFFVDYFETAEAVYKGDIEKAEQINSRFGPPAYFNVRKTLLYAGIVAKSSRDEGEKFLGLALSEVIPLPPEYRVWTISLLAGALMQENPDRAFSLLGEVVQAQNAARATPRSWVNGVPRNPAFARTDALTAMLTLTKDGIIQPFPTIGIGLPVRFIVPPAVTHTLTEVFYLAPFTELQRLEFLAQELKDEADRAEALNTIAELHFLQLAK